MLFVSQQSSVWCEFKQGILTWWIQIICDLPQQKVYVCMYVRTYVRTYVCMYVCAFVVNAKMPKHAAFLIQAFHAGFSPFLVHHSGMISTHRSQIWSACREIGERSVLHSCSICHHFTYRVCRFSSLAWSSTQYSYGWGNFKVEFHCV